MAPTFDDEYIQLLEEMFNWPWCEDEPPPDYTPIEIPPEDEVLPPPERSHELKIATWKSSVGRKLITEMDDSHLTNTISFLKRTDYPNNRGILRLMIEEEDYRLHENQP